MSPPVGVLGHGAVPTDIEFLGTVSMACLLEQAFVEGRIEGDHNGAVEYRLEAFSDGGPRRSFGEPRLPDPVNGLGVEAGIGSFG